MLSEFILLDLALGKISLYQCIVDVNYLIKSLWLDLHIREAHQESLEHWCGAGEEDYVKLLLSDPRVSFREDTILRLAISFQQVGAVKILLADERVDITGCIAIAIIRDNRPMLTTLLSDKRIGGKKDILHEHSGGDGHEFLIRSVLTNDCLISSIEDRGILELAIRDHIPSIVKLLLADGRMLERLGKPQFRHGHANFSYIMRAAERAYYNALSIYRHNPILSFEDSRVEESKEVLASLAVEYKLRYGEEWVSDSS